MIPTDRNSQCMILLYEVFSLDLELECLSHSLDVIQVTDLDCEGWFFMTWAFSSCGLVI